MAARAKIAIAIAILIPVLTLIGGKLSLWISIPFLLLLVVSFIHWARQPRAVEAFIGNLPTVGPYLLKVLEYIEGVLVVQDPEYNKHVRAIIIGYDPNLRSALRTLYRTRNTNLVDSYRQRFVADGLIEYPKDGPGWLKPELRDIVGRTLDELGA
jgi:hypothetical protein